MKDSFGRVIDYVRISLTEKCNLKCIYCMPNDDAKEETKEIIKKDDIIKMIKILAGLGIKKVRYTGGEPLLMKDLENIIRETANIEGIEDISLTTNGILLEDMAEKLKAAGLKRVNISIDSLNKDKFKSITRGGDLGKVIKGIEKAIAIGLKPLKINTVLIKGINDDEVDAFIEMTINLPVHVRFIELMPIGEGKKYYDNGGKMSCEEIIERRSDLEPLKITSDGTARVFKLKGAMGTVGFINPISCKFCDTCNRIRITSDGMIKSCLHSEEEISIGEFFENEEALKLKIEEAIMGKPKEHNMEVENSSRNKHKMYQIGG